MVWLANQTLARYHRIDAHRTDRPMILRKLDVLASVGLSGHEMKESDTLDLGTTHTDTEAVGPVRQKNLKDFFPPVVETSPSRMTKEADDHAEPTDEELYLALCEIDAAHATQADRPKDVNPVHVETDTTDTNPSGTDPKTHGSSQACDAEFVEGDEAMVDDALWDLCDLEG